MGREIGKAAVLYRRGFGRRRGQSIPSEPLNPHAAGAVSLSLPRRLCRPLWLQSIHLLLNAFHVVLDFFDGFHGAFSVSGFSDGHGLSRCLVHQLDGAQVEFSVDNVEGVGADEAEMGVDGNVIEVHGPPAVVEGAGNAVEGDEHVEAGAGGETAEGDEVFLVSVAVDFAVQGDEAVEFGFVGGNAAVQVFSVEVDVIGPAVQVVVSFCVHGAAVDSGFDAGEGHEAFVIMDFPFHVHKVQGRDVEFLHGNVPVGLNVGEGAVSGGGEGHFVVNVIAQAQGGGIHAFGGKFDHGGEVLFFEIDFRVKFHAVAYGGAAEGAGGEAQFGLPFGIDGAGHAYVVHDVVALAVEGLHPAVMDGEFEVERLAAAVEIFHFVFQCFLGRRGFLLFLFLPFHKVHVHILVEADGEGRAVQGDFFQCGGDEVFGNDVPGVHFEGAGGDAEDGISFRIVPGKVFKGDAAVDIGGDGLHGDGAAEHILPGGGVVENAGGAEAGQLGQQEDEAEKGKKDTQDGEGIGGPLFFSAKSGELFLHRYPP